MQPSSALVTVKLIHRTKAIPASAIGGLGQIEKPHLVPLIAITAAEPKGTLGNRLMSARIGIVQPFTLLEFAVPLWRHGRAFLDPSFCSE